ncbi:type II toxin-antitoxin system Phd/YefM family antitoxin [Candidatus Leptofilum sp.]|uniref:type II toxin-antitoxin system Phd/YefM family antitoxin n=1 Tax=Candidatus Leptofilum sp. TaxID=3241576 RepID=UPI003B5BF2D9
MTMVNIHEAKTHFSKLLKRVMSGEEIIIARSGEPVAVLTAVKKPAEDRIPGGDADLVLIKDNFDDPLPEFDI